MSVSSHLTPEPERRLWIILESMGHAVDGADLRIGALTAFAAAELAFIHMAAPGGAAGALGRLSLFAALLLGLFAYSPLTGKAQRVFYLDPPVDKPHFADCMIAVEDLVKYAHGDLIHKLDKYLGGGITATQYYEDIVGRILVTARAASRKRRLFKAACVLVGLGQVGLLFIIV